MSQSDIQSEDSRLHCLTCDYNLTGVTSNRCPECGTEFDREYLISVRDGTGEPGPIPIWDDRATIGFVRAFIQTVLRVWFRPDRFVATFPLVHDKKSSFRFMAATGLAAIGLLIIFSSALCIVWGNYSEPFLFIPAALVVMPIAAVFAQLYSVNLAEAYAGKRANSIAHNRYLGILRFWTCSVLILVVGLELLFLRLFSTGPQYLKFPILGAALLTGFHLFKILLCVRQSTRRAVFDLLVTAPIYLIVISALIGPVSFCILLALVTLFLPLN